MTNNQTIDGVSRAQISDIADRIEHNYPNTAKELRALLDAPASVESLVGRTGGGLVWHECAVCHTKGSYHPDVKWCICGRLFEKPAAQPQGEPVVWLDPSSGRKANTISAALKQYNEAKGGAPAAAAAIYTEPLYRRSPEQPAPAAVVLPEFEPAFEKWWEEDGQYCRAGGGSYEKTFAYRAYEAALADVTRLNPSL